MEIIDAVNRITLAKEHLARFSRCSKDEFVSEFGFDLAIKVTLASHDLVVKSGAATFLCGVNWRMVDSIPSNPYNLDRVHPDFIRAGGWRGLHELQDLIDEVCYQEARPLLAEGVVKECVSYPSDKDWEVFQSQAEKWGKLPSLRSEVVKRLLSVSQEVKSLLESGTPSRT